MFLSAKKRNRKVYITDIAIGKIPIIGYKGLSNEENELIHDFTKLVLWTAQNKNNSDEVALTCSLDSENPMFEVGIAFGDEHEIDICADVQSYHLITSKSRCVIIHNHPSTQTLSVEDIRFFLHFSSIYMMVVVTNQGTVHYICKEENYRYTEAKKMFDTCLEGLTIHSSMTDYYLAGLEFLSECNKAGLFYS